jgi:hypothetical protein
MEQAAAEIIQKAQKAGNWNVRVHLSDYTDSVAYGMELLAGYGWLMFLYDDEAWVITPEFIKRVCQSDTDRSLHNSIMNDG